MGGEATNRVQIRQREFFAGGNPVNIAEQPIYPRSFAKQTGGLEDRLKSRGEKFVVLRGMSVKAYDGPAEYLKESPWSFFDPASKGKLRDAWLPYAEKGRVVLDRKTFEEGQSLESRSNDWDSLAMNEKEILVLRSLVTTHEYSNDARDPLERKGQAAFEAQQAAFEVQLKKLVRYATMFQGIVLLEEADVFLEARGNKAAQPNRNALVAANGGGFLSTLKEVECFSGIVFLTTNRTTARSEGNPLRLGRIETTLEVPDVFEKSSTTDSQYASSSS
ncbi:hypothetical protein DL770_002801 [Monosporascus sp. CRB-9-2]|nr:hypothetical protein DL770_002801 [Monosporascus sp. CRB-9-2]